MAENKRASGGGNKPKPGGNTPKPGVSAKDRSRQQSRPVTAKAAGKGGPARGGRGGTGQGGRAPATSRPAGRPKGPSGTLIAWGAVGVVIIVVVVLVVFNVTGGSGSPSSSTPVPVTPASASVVKDVTSIPASVYDKVGVTSSVPVSPPIVLSGQPALTIDGKSPVMLYYGAEYCPYCAAERWAMTAALSRFGTWSNLKVTGSGKGSKSGPEPFPGTNTFSYRGASFTSPYLTFMGIEQYTNIPNPNGAGYTTLENPTKAQQSVIAKYSSPTFVPGATAGQTAFPFVDINNSMLVSGASFSPGILAGLSHKEIASGLSDAKNPVTRAIVATANYISAGICSSTKGQPASVCQSAGVQAAAKAPKSG